MSPLNKLYTESCKNMEGWRYKLWGNDDITPENFPKTYSYIKKCMQIGNELGTIKKKYAQISDMMRLEILYRHGGVYIDITIECLKNLNKLLNNTTYSFVVSNENDCGFKCKTSNGYYISNSFIASTRYNKILEFMFKQLRYVDFYSPYVNQQTGPYFIGKNIRKLRIKNALKYNINMLPREYI
jgi:mannosyltransferase OCH1-like enzyme